MIRTGLQAEQFAEKEKKTLSHGRGQQKSERKTHQCRSHRNADTQRYLIFDRHIDRRQAFYRGKEENKTSTRAQPSNRRQHNLQGM